MDNCITREINELGIVFLRSLNENDGRLTVDICGSFEERWPKEYVERASGGNEELKRILSEARSVRPDKKTVYRIDFEFYISYNVANESYTAFDPDEIFDGSNFRVYKRSKYLDYINENMFAGQVFDRLTHYGLCCENHIIDVVSSVPPVFSRIRWIGK